jgi:hypothetical protein
MRRSPRLTKIAFLVVTVVSTAMLVGVDPGGWKWGHKI